MFLHSIYFALPVFFFFFLIKFQAITLSFSNQLLFRFLFVLGNHAFQRSQIELSQHDPPLMLREDPHRGILKAFECLEQAQQSFKYDKRLTGSSSLDAALQEVDFFLFGINPINLSPFTL